MNAIRKKRIFFRFLKFWRGFKRTTIGNYFETTDEDRIMIKAVKVMLKRDDIRIFYSPISHSIYMQTPDHKYTIIFNEFEIRIANHHLFLSTKISSEIGNHLMQIGRERIEKEMKTVEAEVRRNEFRFLQDLTKFLETNEENSK
jgi:hypothetical protein